MSDTNDAAIGGFFVGFVLMFVVSLLMGGCICRYYQREAVKHGAAEYVMDPKTGESTWRWKEEPKESPDARE